MDSLLILAADPAAWVALTAKGYVYAAMAFSALVEGLNMLERRWTRKNHTK